MSDSDVVRQYLREIEKRLKVGEDTEGSHRPALQAFIESFNKKITATNEPARVKCGAPDFLITSTPGPLKIGYIETKDINKSLNEIEKSEQLKRYRRSLENLILTDYLEFRWYVDGKLRSSERLARADQKNKLIRDSEGQKKVIELLEAFLKHRPASVGSPKELSERMARLTHMIRDIIVEAFEINEASNLLSDLRQAFAQTLIPDLDLPEKTPEFADMFAQTIAYGLFAARCNHDDSQPFKRLGAASAIPKTNPFLRKLFETITGTDLDDEPYAGFVDDLVQLLNHADMEAILEHFGQIGKNKDPVIHFYESFLAEYDPKLREKRGVYYTPEPVVSYITRSVDHILKTRFNCQDGLADTSKITYELENGEKEKAHKVLILDPACGTGTFLYAVVDMIRDQFMQRRDAGMWSGYVKEHLLPRLFGFELLMAPYAVAHFKLGMQLAGLDLFDIMRDMWRYDFSGDERLQIYLTNTLEEVERSTQQNFFFLEKIIADEAEAAAEVKRDLPIMVILGNPPYSGHSANRSEYMKLIRSGEDFINGWDVGTDGRAKPIFGSARSTGLKKQPTFIGQLIRDYYISDNSFIKERNSKWLQDDYVKFIRWSQWRIECTGTGVLSFITNHSFLDSPTFRGMRQQLLKTFSEIYIFDLHGSTKKPEVPPKGSRDKNVFDIKQGVSIGIFVKEKEKKGPAKIYHSDLWGTRSEKSKRLLEMDVNSTKWERLKPQSPFYLFIPFNYKLSPEYESYWQITSAMPVNVLGFQTHRDKFAIAYTHAEMKKRIDDLRNKNLKDDEVRSKYKLKDNRDWKLSKAREKLKKNSSWDSALTQCLYRPFDWRFCHHGNSMMDYPRREMLDHVANKTNFILISSRQQAVTGYRHSWISTVPPESCVVSTTTREGNQAFPLYLYPNSGKIIEETMHWSSGVEGRVPNFDFNFVHEIETNLKLKFISEGSGDLKETFGPEDILYYIYSILNSPTYRKRYAEFLKIDFPRIPLTTSRIIFKNLSALGQELSSIHLFSADILTKFITSFPYSGNNEVAKGFPKYSEPGTIRKGTKKETSQGRVYINREQYFDGVPAEVWDFYVGGFQVCEKWLKDRRGRKLNYEDLTHYHKIIVALQETIRLMVEIDAAIPSWPIK